MNFGDELDAGQYHAEHCHELDHDCDEAGCPDWARRTFDTTIDDSDIPEE